MSYADRLRAEIGAKGAPCTSDKTDTTPLVSFVSPTSGPFQRRERATAAEAAQLRGLLMRHLGADTDDLAEALAVALRDPGASLRTLRASFPPDCTMEENAALRAMPDFGAYIRGAA